MPKKHKQPPLLAIVGEQWIPKATVVRICGDGAFSVAIAQGVLEQRKVGNRIELRAPGNDAERDPWWVLPGNTDRYSNYFPKRGEEPVRA